MIGMDEVTGKLITGELWLRQAVRRAAKIPKASKPMVRWYGTNILKHIDAPMTNASILELTGDLAESIERTIPDARLATVVTQKNGEELFISMSLGKDKKTIGV
jgi:phage baseplate assembly protein W